jgi:hypothetical protein
MPMIKYQCQNSACGRLYSKIVKAGIKIENLGTCEKCNSESKRLLSSPASSSKIVIDNGLQARATEIHPNIQEINTERARKPANRGD